MGNKARLSNITTLKSKISAILRRKTRSPDQDYQLAELYRSVLRLYSDIHRQSPGKTEKLDKAKLKTLKLLARDAILHFGGEGTPRAQSLKDYDHLRYGPYLGVSDEGSAAHIIREAALNSPKMRVIGKVHPLVVGVAHDAERLGAIGEVPVGPEEYADIRLECIGRILTSTNVGTKLNIRYYKQYPVITVARGPVRKAVRKAKKQLQDTFLPFVNTPDGKPRPLTVFILFDRLSRRTFKDRVAILRELDRYVQTGGIAVPRVHKLGFQMRIGYGAKGCRAALLAVNLASAARIKDVMIDGVVTEEAEAKGSLPGLLAYLPPEYVDDVLKRAAAKAVTLHTANKVDPDTVARNVWSALNAARHMGLDLGKYGTFPLSLKDTDEVVACVQHWFGDWSAAPALFVDQAILNSKRTYTADSRMAGIKEWLKIIRRRKVPVVLIDTVDKAKKYRIYKSGNDPKGLLTGPEIREIDKLASRWGIKVLWAGGITLAQAFEFGRMKVFGIYITSSACSPVAVSRKYADDPLLPAMKEPSLEGVSRAKLLLEAGFLVSRLAGSARAKELEKSARAFIQAQNRNQSAEKIKRAYRDLYDKTVAAWKARPARAGL